jgi:hypothetical protein
MQAFVHEPNHYETCCNARAPSIWAAGAFGTHWGIYFLMRIKSRYQFLGFIFASFFDLERLFE